VKKQRLIPVLLLRNGWLVQSKGFSRYQNLGNPVTAVKRLSQWSSDELIYLDISREDTYDRRRDDLAHPNRGSFLEIIEDVAQVTHMPITVGGKIRTLQDIETRLSLGADKVAVNTRALEEPAFLREASREFGAQCIVLSMDALLRNGRHVVFSGGGRMETAWEPALWARRAEDEGAGEILLNSIDRDGMKNGYDIPLLEAVSSAVRLPVIALGGVGEWEHFSEAFDKTKVDAVAAANIFQYTDQSVYLAKKYLYEKNYNVRPPRLLSVRA
jgi:cyclase